MEKPFAITLEVGSSLANKTGSWRTERAVYVDRLPPCNHACPAGENIQAWLYEAEEGGQGYEHAWRKIMEDNPFPAIMGRVCYHPCETSCNRGQLDEAVGINSVERFLGDQGIEHGWTVEVAAPPSGKRVLVVGAGPSGLSAAYHLTRLGHEVTIHEAGPMAGGMMRFGIPKYRLPRDVLDAEVGRVLDMGVQLELNTKVTDIEQSMRAGGFDAAFLAVGAHISKRAYIPAGESAHILDALSVLRSMEGEEKPMLGRRVVVYGGGNTAMDVARTAKRLGAEEAVVVYRRTRERMPAHDFEVEEAEEEGVMMRWLSTIKQADEGKLLIEKMELDETGFPQPTGELEELEADSVVLALGQDTDLSLLEGVTGIEVEDGVVRVGPNMMTGYRGIFAGGDMVPDERTVTVGIGHGKKAARHIDGWLRGLPYEPPPKPELVTFDMLNTWYYADAPRTVQPQLDPIRRQGTFDEVVQGLDDSNALFEARRCLSCGTCFSCDNCYGVCPDNAVVKVDELALAGDGDGDGRYGPGRAVAGERGERYAIDLDYCKGCGMCVAECPCGAITMEPEAI
jgi:NADPH-dependent glutamate synthase beta subunit-like oxidoreductase